jgi:hypothetical protein
MANDALPRGRVIILKLSKYGSDFRPSVAELLRLLRSPIFKDFFGVVRSSIKIGSCKIENVWTLHDCHFDDPKVIVLSEHFGHCCSANSVDLKFGKTEINISFSSIESLSFEYLDG